MRRLRQLHLYIGLFFAPMLLLFALSGALQVFRLNEERGYGGPPPAWMQWVASIHKNQAPPREKPARPTAAPKQPGETPGDRRPAGEAPPRPGMGVLGLKIFVVLLGIALIASTLLGILIALNTRPARRVGIIMLVAGTVLPIVLLKL